MTLRATPRLVLLCVIAERYAPREPPKRAARIERSAAITSTAETGATRCWTARANAFENASSGSPVRRRIGLIADHPTAAVPSRQRRPELRISWPSVFDLLKPAPAARGPLQRFGLRVQR